MVKSLQKPSRFETAPASIEWRESQELEDYGSAVAWMEARTGAIARGKAAECVWLLEHPPLYTAGTSAREADLLTPSRLPVYRTGRGGQYTYHGPGQRVAYVMLDLRPRGCDIRAYVRLLEDWIIASLDRFGVAGERRPDRIGVWIPRPELGPNREDKIAAIGVRVRHWVSFHGIAINVDPDLSHFSGIVPCGVHDQGVTSLADLGLKVGLQEVDAVLKATFEEVIGAPRALAQRRAASP